jgi:hypothetical protein
MPKFAYGFSKNMEKPASLQVRKAIQYKILESISNQEDLNVTLNDPERMTT